MSQKNKIGNQIRLDFRRETAAFLIINSENKVCYHTAEVPHTNTPNVHSWFFKKIAQAKSLKDISEF